MNPFRFEVLVEQIKLPPRVIIVELEVKLSSTKTPSRTDAFPDPSFSLDRVRAIPYVNQRRSEKSLSCSFGAAAIVCFRLVPDRSHRGSQRVSKLSGNFCALSALALPPSHGRGEREAKSEREYKEPEWVSKSGEDVRGAAGRVKTGGYVGNTPLHTRRFVDSGTGATTE